MGTTKKPLKIYVTEAELLPLLQPYVEKGHHIAVLDIGDFDAILGIRGHRIPNEMLRDMPEKAIKLAIQGITDRVYPPTKGRMKQ